MRIPEKPKAFHELVSGLAPERLQVVLAGPLRPEVGGKYLHWDDLRRHAPPDGLALDEWWLRIHLSRSATQLPLPLQDKEHLPFRYLPVDSIQRLLHGIERDLGNPENKDRYLVNSLMEEAITSSQLEGASATRKVAKQMLLSGREPRDRDERMIANNFRAMELVRAKVGEPMTPALILELHEVLTQGTLESEQEVGRFRRKDENITVLDIADGQVLHLPPDAEELPERMATLCAFANTDFREPFVHPIARAILLHFMLAYDHPFVDGNGRTARALFYWSMLRQKYWMTEFLSISRVIQQAPAQYARAFLHTETDGGDTTYFVRHQLEVLRQAIDDLHAYLKRKSEEVHEVERQLKATRHLNDRQRLLLAHGLRHPDARYTVEGYQREYGVAYATARSDLLTLAEAGHLDQEKVGRRFHFTVPANLGRRLKGK